MHFSSCSRPWAQASFQAPLPFSFDLPPKWVKNLKPSSKIGEGPSERYTQPFCGSKSRLGSFGDSIFTAQKRHWEHSSEKGHYHFLLPHEGFNSFGAQAHCRDFLSDIWMNCPETVTELYLQRKQPKTHKPPSPQKKERKKKTQEKETLYFFNSCWFYDIYYIYVIIERFHIYYEKYENWPIWKIWVRAELALFSALSPLFNTIHATS